MKDKFKDVNLTNTTADNKKLRLLGSVEMKLIKSVLGQPIVEDFIKGRVSNVGCVVEVMVVLKDRLKELPKDMPDTTFDLSRREFHDSRLRRTMDAIEYYLRQHPMDFIQVPTDGACARPPAFAIHPTDDKYRVYVNTPAKLIRVSLKPLEQPEGGYNDYRVVFLQNLHSLLKEYDKKDRSRAIEHVFNTVECAAVLYPSKPQITVVGGVELWRTAVDSDTWSPDDGEFGFRTLSNETLKRACEVLSEDEIEDWYKAVERIALG